MKRKRFLNTNVNGGDGSGGVSGGDDAGAGNGGDDVVDYSDSDKYGEDGEVDNHGLQRIAGQRANSAICNFAK